MLELWLPVFRQILGTLVDLLEKPPAFRLGRSSLLHQRLPKWVMTLNQEVISLVQTIQKTEFG